MIITHITNLLTSSWSIGLLILILGFLVGKLFAEKNLKKLTDKAQQDILFAEQKYKEIVANSDKYYQDALERGEKDIQTKLKFLESQEQKLTKKEEKLEQKEEELDRSKEELAQKTLEHQRKQKEAEEMLSRISQLSPDEAKEKLLEGIKQKYSSDIFRYGEKLKADIIENAKQEAIKVLTTALPRIATEYTGEYTSTLVDLPSEDTKGRIIGREGRNIAVFEKTTGVEIIIDDTPLVVKLASYDPEKRFLAVETLKRLIKDGRINPLYIEKTYQQIVLEKDEIIYEKGKEATAILGIKLPPEVSKLVGKFFFRYSYGQNLWGHSIEVAKLAGLIANELGLDPILAKKAGLLHDIGKISEQSNEGHAKIGAEMLKSLGMDEVTVNTAAGHHFDVPLTHPIGWIVTAADAVSAARPGARYDTRELYIDRMSGLEKLVLSNAAVNKAYIMQAGREIMAFVDPQKIDDIAMQELVAKIAEDIEQNMEYPGMIKVVGIRESTAIATVR